jgi:asparaginyl-tRNA synthetase
MRAASLTRLAGLTGPSLRCARLTRGDSPLPQHVSRARSFGRTLSSASLQGPGDSIAVGDAQDGPKTIAKLLAWNPNTDVPVVVNGYVHAVRSMKRVTFVSINDGSSVTHLQAVVSPDQADGCEP